MGSKKHQHGIREDAKSRKHSKTFPNEYNGYYPDKDSLDTVKLSDMKSKKFYNNYVKTRRPCLIEGVISGLDLDIFQPATIVSKLHTEDQMLLVEKKHRGGFGSGTERVKMTFKDLMKNLRHGGDDYYLTTQYTEDDPDEINKTLQQLQEDLEDEASNEDDKDGPLKEDSDVDDDGSDEVGDEDEQVPEIPNGDAFSETDSIDFNDVHDDFDDLNDHSAPQDDIISTDLPGGSLTYTEAQERVHEFVQKPLTNLVSTGDLPLQPKLLTKLTPQQINIWVGKSKTGYDGDFKIKEHEADFGLGRRVFGGGVSSGLHHDHADNLYIPVSGSKRFTIFAPSDAAKMYTVGDINRVYGSGVIDYKNNESAAGWRALRGDSAIITEVAKWKLDNDETLSQDERESLIELVDREEEELQDFESKVVDEDGVKKDPPSFSRVPASILHLDKITDKKLQSKLQDFAHQNWPKFFEAKRITAHIQPGQMLYLPAGWFHEVTSFGSTESKSDNIHIALNYWYSPPDDDENVYSDDYWREDFRRTLEACKHFDRTI